ncbi:MAG TPA: hypothetical protein VGH36_13405 [Acetobacteraceae bacterium]|jgi:hypothetical protein
MKSGFPSVVLVGLAAIVIVVAGMTAFAGPVVARTVPAGPARELKTPSAALAAAEDGDIVLIDPGEYFDCLSIQRNRVTIAGAGAGVVFTDRTYEGKALVVTHGNDIVLRDVTLQRARVPDGNGAGIRAEGRNLTVANVRFVNDQAGIIAADSPASTLIVSDTCDGPHCVRAITVGAIARSTIDASKGGHQIVSDAAMTELAGDRITDGPTGASSYQVMLEQGGGLVMEGSEVEKGPKSGNTRCAILLDGTITGPLAFRRNRFENDTCTAMPFIVNWTGVKPELEGNAVRAKDAVVSTSGRWLHALREGYLGAKDGARHAAGAAVRKVKGWRR